MKINKSSLVLIITSIFLLWILLFLALLAGWGVGYSVDPGQIELIIFISAYIKQILHSWPIFPYLAIFTLAMLGWGILSLNRLGKSLYPSYIFPAICFFYFLLKLSPKLRYAPISVWIFVLVPVIWSLLVSFFIYREIKTKPNKSDRKKK